MKHILIITEDISKIQTLTGFLGGVFKRIYIGWLKLRLKLTLLLFSPFFKLTVVASDIFGLGNYQYGDELAKNNYAKNRRRHLNVTDRLLKNFPGNLFKNRLAIYLTYDYFIYAQLYEALIKRIRPDIVLTLSGSYHEQIAQFLAREKKIKILRIHFFTLVWLNHRLKHFFLRRQFSKKARLFMIQSRRPVPPINRLRSATLLSLDFFRHLKILTPIYQKLNQKGQNPWLVADYGEPKASARYFYLAGFLPKEFKIQPVALPASVSAQTLEDFLYNLSISAAAPMINYCQKLSQLYQAAAINLFKQIKPRAVVVVSDARFGELALAAAARATKTRSLLVSPNTILALDKLNGYDTTDRVAVVGEFIKDQLICLGLPQRKITVVGDPQTENYREIADRLNIDKVRRTLKIKPEQKIALLVSFGPSQMIPKPEKEAFIKMASQAVQAVSNLVLVIKPHPSEKRYRILGELEEWGIRNTVVSDNNQLELAQLLKASSLVLQTWSMTIFEAIVMNRPVISVNPLGKNYGAFVPIIAAGGAVEVKTLKELIKWLRIFSDPEHQLTQKQLERAKQACSKFIRITDGRAAGKVAGLLTF